MPPCCYGDTSTFTLRKASTSSRNASSDVRDGQDESFGLATSDLDERLVTTQTQEVPLTPIPKNSTSYIAECIAEQLDLAAARRSKFIYSATVDLEVPCCTADIPLGSSLLTVTLVYAPYMHREFKERRSTLGAKLV